MQTVTTIGLDIAKSVFQVHGVDAAGQVVIRRQIKRRHVSAFFQKLPPCLVGIEACATAHHWSRELQALGHTDLQEHTSLIAENFRRRTTTGHPDRALLIEFSRDERRVFDPFGGAALLPIVVHAQQHKNKPLRDQTPGWWRQISAESLRR